MINPAERHIGHEILEAQSRLTQKRFRSPLASGRSPFTRYEKALEEQQVFELIPSNLTAYVVMSDLGYNRMQRSVNSSQSLPQEAVLYMKQSVVTIHTLMNNLMSLNLAMNGFICTQRKFPDTMKSMEKLFRLKIICLGMIEAGFGWANMDSVFSKCLSIDLRDSFLILSVQREHSIVRSILQIFLNDILFKILVFQKKKLLTFWNTLRKICILILCGFAHSNPPGKINCPQIVLKQIW
jgi:hypothetical protein